MSNVPEHDFYAFIHWKSSKVDPDLTFQHIGRNGTWSQRKTPFSIMFYFWNVLFRNIFFNFGLIFWANYPFFGTKITFFFRCAASSDDSVVILENGQGNNARFKFNMFKWRSKTSYIYMHCEVHLCDKEKETCSNDDVSTNSR